MKYIFAVLVTTVLILIYSFTLLNNSDNNLSSCMIENKLSFSSQLYIELEKFSFENFDAQYGNFKELSEKFCNEDDINKFKISTNSKLDQLIKHGIKQNFWEFNPYDIDEPTIINGDTVIITPPAGEKFTPLKDSEVEKASLNPNSKYFECCETHSKQKDLLFYYGTYETIKVAPSRIKLCVLKDFFDNNDYNLNQIKHYILVHCICQKLIHSNDYYKYFENYNSISD